MSMKSWVLVLVGGVATALPAAAQTTESEIAARLLKKPLYLRGMWADDKLSFDSHGKPTKAYKAVPFTEAAFDATSVKMRADHLQIEGQRVALEFDSKAKMKRVKLEARDYSGHMTINIQGPTGTDFGVALDAIFAPDLASLVPVLPVYWQSFARRTFLSPTAEAAAGPSQADPAWGVEEVGERKERPVSATAVSALHIGGTVKPPKVLKSVEPDFSDVARALKFSGNVQVYLWVDENGAPSHLKLVRPVGLGLDEAALYAVQQYKFAPAIQNGKPVKVDLYIDVNFQIF